MCHFLCWDVEGRGQEGETRCLTTDTAVIFTTENPCMVKYSKSLPFQVSTSTLFLLQELTTTLILWEQWGYREVSLHLQSVHRYGSYGNKDLNSSHLYYLKPVSCEQTWWIYHREVPSKTFSHSTRGMVGMDVISPGKCQAFHCHVSQHYRQLT